MSPLARAVLAAVEAEPDVWSVQALADDLDVSRYAIRKAVDRLEATGHAVRLRHYRTAQRSAAAEAARRLFREGARIETIATALGRTVTTIEDYLGDEAPRRQQYAEQVLSLLGSIPARSLTCTEIAARVGCSDRYARHVVQTCHLGRYVRRSAWEAA